MAKTISIPITDHDSECTQYYTVEHKLTTESAYSTSTQYASPIVINNVLDSVTYDVRITRRCCNNVNSVPLVLSIDTTSTSPILSAPANFTLTLNSPPVPGQLIAAWDDVTNAEGYYGVLSTTSDFASIAYYFNTVDPLLTVTIPGLVTGQVYYGKVRAAASGYTDSPYSNVDNETAP